MPTKFYPFLNRDSNGPGPKKQTNHKAGKWSCACEQINKDLSICKCTGIRTLKNGKTSKARKTVRINLRKKRGYQKTYYRPYLKAKRQRGEK